MAVVGKVTTKYGTVDLKTIFFCPIDTETVTMKSICSYVLFTKLYMYNFVHKLVSTVEKARFKNTINLMLDF